MRQPGPDLVAIVAHARDVPVAQRGPFASRVRRELGERALVLETCHRVEAYWLDSNGASDAAPPDWLPAGARQLRGAAAARHAIAVAVGRDSVVVGEDQVLHQLRESVEAVRRSGTFDTTLERLFALATQAGRRARSWQQGPSRSLADLALAEIVRRAGPLAGRGVLVVGAGRMGRLAAVAAVGAGADVSITSRSSERARTLAASIGARTEGFDPGKSIGTGLGIVVALSGPWTIAGATIDALVSGSAIVVDLSVPPAVDPTVLSSLGDRAISADALAMSELDGEDGSAAWLARLDALIDQTTRDYLDWRDGHESRATADALIRRADREREAELELLWTQLPHLEPEARAAIDGMARHLTRRLMREPLERLGRDLDGSDERAVRDIFAL